MIAHIPGNCLASKGLADLISWCAPYRTTSSPCQSDSCMRVYSHEWRWLAPAMLRCHHTACKQAMTRQMEGYITVQWLVLLHTDGFLAYFPLLILFLITSPLFRPRNVNKRACINPAESSDQVKWTLNYVMRCDVHLGLSLRLSRSAP